MDVTRREYYVLKSSSHNRTYNFIRGTGNDTISSTQNPEEPVNNRPCITENCLGYLNRKGECPICNRTTCLSCIMDKTGQENHEM